MLYVSPLASRSRAQSRDISGTNTCFGRARARPGPAFATPLIPRSAVVSSSKAGRRNEQLLADIQPTSANEPLPHSLPKLVSKTSAIGLSTGEQTPTTSQHPSPVIPEQQPSHLATKKVDFQRELVSVSYKMSTWSLVCEVG